MVAGLKFLSKKGFNPQNNSNRKRVWEAQQQRKAQEKRAIEREAQLRRERDDQELAFARGDVPKLSFMYKQPPGLNKEKNNEKSNDDPKKMPFRANNLNERQPGDDDAAAAFRRLLAGASTEEKTKATNETAASASSTPAFGTVLQGSTYETERSLGDRTALEKAVGRRTNGGLTLDEQMQRFPALANAPRTAGLTATDVGVKFNPLGTQIRNVRCMACGIWGHRKGDRECGKSGWDPFAVVARDISIKETSLDRRKNHNCSGGSVESEDSSRRKRKRRKKKRRKEEYDSGDDSRRRRKKSHKRRKYERKA